MEATAEHNNSSTINLKIIEVEEYGDETILTFYMKMVYVNFKVKTWIFALCGRKLAQLLCNSRKMGVKVSANRGNLLPNICPKTCISLLYAIPTQKICSKHYKM